MNKDFKTIEDQLNLLKSRGIVFEDENFAKQVLLSKNYFDIINGFESLLLIDSKDKQKNYPSGTNFDHFLDLYHFDKILSTSIFRSIEDFEIKFKTSIAYRFAEYVFSNNPKENPDFYKNIKFYDNPYSINNLYDYIDNLGPNDKNPGGPYEIKLKQIKDRITAIYSEITSLQNDLNTFNSTNLNITVYSKNGKTKVNYHIRKINSFLQSVNTHVQDLNNNILISNANTAINVNIVNLALINSSVATQINQIQTNSQNTRERINNEIDSFINNLDELYSKFERLFSKIAINDNKTALSRYPHDELKKFANHNLFQPKNSFIDKQKELYDYIKIYDKPPIWVFIKCFTLGETALLFHGLKKEIVKNVLSDLELDTINIESSKNILLNSISIITDLRNNCAHFGLIQHFKTKSSLLIHSELISKLDLHPKGGKHELKLYDSLLVLNQFTDLNEISTLFQKYFENKQFLIKSSLKRLLKQMGNENMVDWISF